MAASESVFDGDNNQESEGKPRLHESSKSYILEPDNMSRAGPVSLAGPVCRDDFQPGIT